MAIMKVIEIMAESPKSWEDATRIGIKKASESVKGVASAYVNEQSVTVKDGDVEHFRVNLKLTFKVND